MEIKLLDCVALLDDMPEEGLRRGEIGAVVEVYEPDAVEVEFVDRNGQTYAMLAIPVDRLLRIIERPAQAA
ncbi:MAG: DUF4926 domain-containing protein [Bryobacteraceae bacterium]|nr:DUF4926 domain-containing protein [Bryobacteraceae bacterium]